MRTVLITGVNGGIGSATAEVFKREGWQVIGVDCVPQRESLSCDEYHVVDLSDENQINSLFTAVSREDIRLDALVNNAAVQLCKPLLETAADEWDALMAVNLRAAYLVMKSSHPFLCKPGGAIVNVGSVHARATSRNIAAYAASKGALEALTRAVALEFATDGIRVNGLHPGAVETEMLMAGFRRGHLLSDTVEAQTRQLGEKHPLNRVGQPAEIAEAILFLADESRSSFITGAFLVADGGALSRLATE